MTYDFLFHWSLHIFSAIGIFLVPVLIIMLRRRRTALARIEYSPQMNHLVFLNEHH